VSTPPGGLLDCLLLLPRLGRDMGLAVGGARGRAGSHCLLTSTVSPCTGHRVFENYSDQGIRGSSAPSEALQQAAAAAEAPWRQQSGEQAAGSSRQRQLGQQQVLDLAHEACPASNRQMGRCCCTISSAMPEAEPDKHHQTVLCNVFCLQVPWQSHQRRSNRRHSPRRAAAARTSRSQCWVSPAPAYLQPGTANAVCTHQAIAFSTLQVTLCPCSACSSVCAAEVAAAARDTLLAQCRALLSCEDPGGELEAAAALDVALPPACPRPYLALPQAAVCSTASPPAACPWLSTVHAALPVAGLLPHDPLFALLPPAATACRGDAAGPERAAAALAAAAARAAALTSAAGWGRMAERGLAASLLPAALHTCRRKRGSSGLEGAAVPGTATPAQALAARMAAGKRQRLLLLTAATAGATPAHGTAGSSRAARALPQRHAGGRRVARDLSFTPPAQQQQQEQQTGARSWLLLCLLLLLLAGVCSAGPRCISNVL
jgi:hypothetical protein